jgi:hypothetical protein
MTNFVRAVAMQLGRAELERIANALLAAGQLTDEEGRELQRQIDSLRHPELLPLGPQGDGRKRPPGRPRKDGTAAGAPPGSDSEGVDLGALAAGQV